MARIGEIDSDGVTIGFIDRTGLGWRSRVERDGAVASGRWGEAYYSYLRGTRRYRPIMRLYVIRYCSRPSSWSAALADCVEEETFRDHLSRARDLIEACDGS